MTRRCSRAFAEGIGEHGAVVASADPAATTAEHGLDAVGRDDLGRVAREIRRADSVVVAGGTIFKTLHPASGRPPLALLSRTAALAAVARALRKPFALVGVGAAPLQGASARGLARATVRAADLLILRDEESAAHLADIGAPTPIRVGADAAWTLLPLPGETGGQTPCFTGRLSLPSAIWRATATWASGSPPACSRSSTPGSRCGSIRGRSTATPSWRPTSRRGSAAMR